MLNTITLTGGTHGNETSGIQLIRDWLKFGLPSRFSALNVDCSLANTAAIAANVRFLDEDLNRQFTTERLAGDNPAREAVLAKELNQKFGPKGNTRTDFFIDIHNTTSNMGATLIVLENDDFNVKLARFVKQAMPEANILVEDEKAFADHGYLCTVGKKGVMIEVGAQPQGVLREDVYQLTLTMAEAILDFCVAWNNQDAALNELPPCEAFRLGYELKFPLDEDGMRKAMIHHIIQDQDFIPLLPGAPMFRGFDGSDYVWDGEKETYPHFVNEAAYHKLDVAFSTSDRIEF